MVRRRGGGATGQGGQIPQGAGGRGGGKRTATTPVGNLQKDMRRDLQEYYSEDLDGNASQDGWEEVRRDRRPERGHTDVPEGQSSPGPQRRTFAEAAGNGVQPRPQTQREERDPGARRGKGLFKTPPPEGSKRDDITIEVRKVNGTAFKGSLHFKEAKYGIFQNCLQLNPSLIHGLRFGYSDFPLVRFKLKEQIYIDAFLPKEYFDYKRDYTVGGVQKSDTLECKIRGIRNDATPIGESQEGRPLNQMGKNRRFGIQPRRTPNPHVARSIWHPCWRTFRRRAPGFGLGGRRSKDWNIFNQNASQH